MLLVFAASLGGERFPSRGDLHVTQHTENANDIVRNVLIAIGIVAAPLAAFAVMVALSRPLAVTMQRNPKAPEPVPVSYVKEAPSNEQIEQAIVGDGPVAKPVVQRSNGYLLSPAKRDELDESIRKAHGFSKDFDSIVRPQEMEPYLIASGFRRTKSEAHKEVGHWFTWTKQVPDIGTVKAFAICTGVRGKVGGIEFSYEVNADVEHDSSAHAQMDTEILSAASSLICKSVPHMIAAVRNLYRYDQLNLIRGESTTPDGWEVYCFLPDESAADGSLSNKRYLLNAPWTAADGGAK